MGEGEGTKPTSAPDHSLQKTSSNRRLKKGRLLDRERGGREEKSMDNSPSVISNRYETCVKTHLRIC
jgi:hypothetical protein